jgi:hypothetical protein
VTLTPAETDRELDEFERFARANPNAQIYVKRWQRTTRDYEFGLVLVTNGRIEPRTAASNPRST